MLIPIESEEQIQEIEVFMRSDSLFVKFSSIYEVHKVLGVGSYGVVAEVTEIDKKRKIAIKICKQDLSDPSPSVQAL